MKKYEITFVYPKENNSIGAKLEKLIASVKAKVVKKDNWGIKKLAYPIKKQTEAKYLCFTAEMEPQGAKELENKIKLEENLLRYLIVNAK